METGCRTKKLSTAPDDRFHLGWQTLAKSNERMYPCAQLQIECSNRNLVGATLKLRTDLSR
ncbi:hypothetical protein DAI22_04g091300 [Oryza sativa Japonica Group]|nr:hypothetical protein DAI22_04g091300 [Oryza sativa Japonica Group]